MKKMKKIVFFALLLSVAFMFGACGSTDGDAEWPAMDKLSSVQPADITSIDFSHAGEGGVESGSTSDSTEIENIYLRLKDVTLGSKTDMSVVDDDMSISVKTSDENINFYFTGDIAVLENDVHYETENLSSLKSYINSLIDETVSDEATSDKTSPGGTTSDKSGPAEAMQDASDYKAIAAYDITKGLETKISDVGDIEYIYFNDFMITMPNNDKWSYETEKDSVTFYLFSAQQEGYGGKLVTIKAYSLTDDSYENLPSYQVAGVGGNTNVRFVAIYPSDVQCNLNDTTQKADYEDLYSYLKKIGEGAVNSPLRTQDSD